MTRGAWETWQNGLAERFTLPADLPPLRMLLVWDDLAGHKTAEMVVWLCRHGVMPLYTPLGGSWLNMAESVQRILKRRTLDGQHPQSPAEEPGRDRHLVEQTAQAWNRQPTPSGGTASAGEGGESAPAKDTPSAVRALTSSCRSPRTAAAGRNGTARGK